MLILCICLLAQCFITTAYIHICLKREKRLVRELALLKLAVAWDLVAHERVTEATQEILFHESMGAKK